MDTVPFCGENQRPENTSLGQVVWTLGVRVFDVTADVCAQERVLVLFCTAMPELIWEMVGARLRSEAEPTATVALTGSETAQRRHGRM
eukprot:3934114-Rhodomonas_salina.2